MIVTLPDCQGKFLARLVATGRFATQDEAVVEAVRRLQTDEALNYINPPPLTVKEAEAIYGPDADWEAVEVGVAGQIRPEV